MAFPKKTRVLPRPSKIDDQIVPIGASAHASSKLVKNATLKVYPGGPHGLADTHKDELNADLFAFLRG